MLIRLALPSEALVLSSLALRSKAHWPYDPVKLAAYRPQLEVFLEDIVAGSVFVAELDSRVVGFYALSSDPASWRLHFLFVEPKFIGRRFGKLLWLHALDSARGRGWRSLSFYADGYAVDAFYKYQNCRVVGQLPSDLGPLTLMCIDLI